jgi:hypothetical protein
VGRRCDQCAENFAGMDEMRCNGEFSLSLSPSLSLFLSLPLPPPLTLSISFNFQELVHSTEAANLKKNYSYYVAATIVYGRFSFLSLLYERELENSDSTNFKELSGLLSTAIERELYSFALPGRFEAKIESFSNR